MSNFFLCRKVAYFSLCALAFVFGPVGFWSLINYAVYRTDGVWQGTLIFYAIIGGGSSLVGLLLLGLHWSDGGWGRFGEVLRSEKVREREREQEREERRTKMQCWTGIRDVTPQPRRESYSESMRTLR